MANTPFDRFVVIEFACKHRREFPAKGNVPAKGDAIICLRCRSETTVVRKLEEYRVRCSDCRYSRPFGANSLQAEIAASKHHNRYPYHLVTLWHGVRKAREWPRNEQQLFTKALPGDPASQVDVPPF